MDQRAGRGADDAAPAALADADKAVLRGEQTPSTRVPLDRGRIVGAALAFIDANSVALLTMRRLGSLLGVEAMSLYRYVPSRDDLLDGVVQAIVDEMYDDPDVLTEPRDGWQDFLQRLAHGVRRAALAHPKAFPLVAGRPPEAPWLRPPLRDLAWVESFLSALVSADFSDRAAVEAYRAFTSFLLGHLLLEVANHGADVGPLDVLEPESDDTGNLGEYPLVRRMRPALSEDHAAAEFEESLENLMERIQLLKLQQGDNGD